MRIKLLSIIALLLIGCKQEPQNSDLLVGTHRTLDRNIPFPYLLDKNEDSIFFINHKNEVVDKIQADSIAYKTGDTIQMPRHAFTYLKHGFWIVSSDTTSSVAFPFRQEKFIGWFKHATETEDFEVNEVKKQLSQNQYEAKVLSATPNSDLELVKTWQFSKDSLKTILSYYYQGEWVHSEQQIKKYHLFERSGKLFFSENETTENPQVLYQIVDFNAESFSVQHYDRNHKKIRERYQRAKEEKLSSEIPFYSRCLEGQAGQYYHDGITYNKGNEYLLRKISENAPTAQGDGYITVHFLLNCRGKLGRIGLEQMDRNYKTTSFDPTLVKHIIAQVRQLTDWPEVKSGYAFKDVHAFLMFKIENGKITDLCP